MITVKGNKIEIKFPGVRAARMILGERTTTVEIKGDSVYVEVIKVAGTPATIQLQMERGEIIDSGYCDCGGICRDHEPRIPPRYEESYVETIRFE
jgi:hypothetical protein